MIANNGIKPAPVKQEDNLLSKIEYKTKEEHATLDRDDFMRLFVTQLQYQDPMNPMESAEMASQVAQFNMVDLMYKNNKALQDMTKAQNMATSVTAIGLLGHKVQYEGDRLLISEKGVEPFFIEAPEKEAVTECSVTIIDDKGKIVKKMDIGPINAGERKKLEWDGKDSDENELPQGTYKVSVTATNEKGDEIDITTWTTGIVSGVKNAENGLPQLLIQDGPKIEFKDITKVES